MSRQLEAIIEERQARREKGIIKAVEYGLVGSVGHAGGELVGFSVLYRGSDVLLVLKAVFPGGKQVSFVGSDTLGSALVKACREARADKLVWKKDQYGG